MISITATIQLDEQELQFSTMRAAGPGGQHVNRTESAVRVQLDVANSPSLPPGLKHRLRALAGSRLSADGILALTSDEHRSQLRNREEVVARLVDLLRRAAVPPKHRVPTKVSKAAKARRCESKNRRGTVKDNRRRPAAE